MIIGIFKEKKKIANIQVFPKLQINSIVDLNLN